MRWRDVLPRAGQPPERGTAVLTVVAALTLAGLGTTVHLAFGGTGVVATAQVGGQAPRPLPPGTAAWWGFALIAGYGPALVFGTTAALWVSQPRTAMHEVARFARVSGLIAAVSDVLGHVLLLVATSNPDPVLLEFVSAAGITAACALPPALLLACYGVGLTLVRCSRRPRRDPPEACVPRP